MSCSTKPLLGISRKFRKSSNAVLKLDSEAEIISDFESWANEIPEYIRNKPKRIILIKSGLVKEYRNL